MKHQNHEEKVGDDFDEMLLLEAQSKSWRVLQEVASLITPGMTENEAHALMREKLKSAGAEKAWHPNQIRFGVNTSKPYGVPSTPDVRLQENDVFFIDCGPVFHGYEGDVGATFAVGNDPELRRLAADAKHVFDEVKAYWKTSGVSGPELYTFAEDVARRRGWRLSQEGASGHRVSEFPHSAHYRGKLHAFARQPAPNRWILEIHLHHPSRSIGAFYEDIL